MAAAQAPFGESAALLAVDRQAAGRSRWSHQPGADLGALVLARFLRQQFGFLEAEAVEHEFHVRREGRRGPGDLVGMVVSEVELDHRSATGRTRRARLDRLGDAAEVGVGQALLDTHRQHAASRAGVVRKQLVGRRVGGNGRSGKRRETQTETERQDDPHNASTTTATCAGPASLHRATGPISRLYGVMVSRPLRCTYSGSTRGERGALPPRPSPALVNRAWGTWRAGRIRARATAAAAGLRSGRARRLRRVRGHRRGRRGRGGTRRRPWARPRR